MFHCERLGEPTTFIGEYIRPASLCKRYVGKIPHRVLDDARVRPAALALIVLAGAHGGLEGRRFTLNETLANREFGMNARTFMAAIRQLQTLGCLTREQGSRQNGKRAFAQDTWNFADAPDSDRPGYWLPGNLPLQHGWKAVAIHAYAASFAPGYELAISQIRKRFGFCARTAKGQVAGMVEAGLLYRTRRGFVTAHTRPPDGSGGAPEGGAKAEKQGAFGGLKGQKAHHGEGAKNAPHRITNTGGDSGDDQAAPCQGLASVGHPDDVTPAFGPGYPTPTKCQVNQANENPRKNKGLGLVGGPGYSPEPELSPALPINGEEAGFHESPEPDNERAPSGSTLHEGTIAGQNRPTPEGGVQAPTSPGAPSATGAGEAAGGAGRGYPGPSVAKARPGPATGPASGGKASAWPETLGRPFAALCAAWRAMPGVGDPGWAPPMNL